MSKRGHRPCAWLNRNVVLLRASGFAICPEVCCSATGRPGRDNESGVPAGRAAAGWRVDRGGVDSAACDQPRDQRVGVPHLASLELVSPPDGRGDLRDEVEQPSGDGWV